VLRSRSVRRLRLPAIVLAAALVLSVAPVLGDSSDTKAERERVRQGAAAVAAELDPLMAEDAELEEAVAALTAEVDAQQAKVDAVRVAITAAEARQAELEIEIGVTEADQAAIMARVRDRAVAEFVGTGSDDVDAYWSAPDLNLATRQRGLTDNVIDSEVDAVDALRGVESRLEGLVAEQEATRAQLVELEGEREARLGDLSAALVEQERLQAALDARIAEFVAEADALAAEEEALTALLRRQLSDEEAAAAAAAAAAEAVSTPASSGGGATGGSGGAPPPSNPGAQLSWPASGVVTSGFGPRWGRMHQGIDIAAASGTPVYAAAAGTVITAGYNGGYGNWVVIDHGSGMSTVYAHHSQLSVSAGQRVSAGSQVGLMGSTGNSTGPHVHFEVRINGTPYDPMAYL